MAKQLIVGCKLPNGIKLQLRGPINPTSGACDIVWECSLQGSAQNLQPYVRENGVGLTMVPEEEWLAWEVWAQESHYLPYINGLVFAASSQREVQAEAKDKIELKTGLEGLDLPLHPDAPASKDPRLSGFRKDELKPTVALV